MMGAAKKLGKWATGGAFSAAGASQGVTQGLLSASAVGVAGFALAKSPAADVTKQQLGLGEDTSLVSGMVTSKGVSMASPPGQNYMGDLSYGPEGAMGTGFGAYGEASIAAGVAGGAAGAYIGGGSSFLPSGGGHQGNVFNTKGGPGKALGSKMLGRAKNTAKGAANLGMSVASSSKFIRGSMGALGAAGAISIIGDTVDRVARKVVQTGTPASQRLPSPKKSTKTASRSAPTTGGVARNAGRGPGARGSPSMTGSTVLALHKTGGSGGVLT